MNNRIDLYADGGVILNNPSKIGGTYAYIMVKGDKIVRQESGVYTPKQMGTPEVTNNQMELLSILIGLQYAQSKGYEVQKICSDSQVTLGRMFKNWSLKNIPAWMVELKSSLMYFIRHTSSEHVRGHNGHKWNEMCDLLCQGAGQKYILK